MSYVSVLATIIAVWISAVVMSMIISDTGTRHQLFMLVLGFNLILFLIGFGRKR